MNNYKSNTSKNLRVWDAQKNKLLCRFDQGVYETDDERIIKVLESVPEVELVGASSAPVKSKAADNVDSLVIDVDGVELTMKNTLADMREFAEELEIELPAAAKSKKAVMKFLAKELADE